MTDKPDRNTDRPKSPMFVRRVLIVLGLVALFFLAWQLRTLLLMFFGAMVIASIFRAVADWICRVDAAGEAARPRFPSLGPRRRWRLIALFGAHVATRSDVGVRRCPRRGAVEARSRRFRVRQSARAVVASITTPARSCRLRPHPAVGRQRAGRPDRRDRSRASIWRRSPISTGPARSSWCRRGGAAGRRSDGRIRNARCACG